MEFGAILTGVKVVELATYAAAPAIGRMMADWGAEVIKIEGKEGDPVRAFSASMGMPCGDDENPIWQLENANKKGISLDLKHPDGMEALHRLLAQADVFISNTRLGSLKKLGLDYETLSAKYPRLIWAHVSGLGPEGEESGKPGFDITAYWARSGALMDMVQPDQPPINSPSAGGDHPAALALTAGVCAALVKQGKTGKGDRVSLSLLGAAIWNFGFMAVSTQYGDVFPKGRLAPMHPLNTSYRCADGEWIMLTLVEYERYYAATCKVLGLEHLINDSRFSTLEAVKQNKAALVDIITAAFLTQGRDYWLEKLQAADIVCETIRHFKDMHKDPQAWVNSNLTQYTFDNGHEAVLPCTPVQFSANVPPPCRRAPGVGEDTDAVLSQYGYTADQLKAMHASGAIYTKGR